MAAYEELRRAVLERRTVRAQSQALALFVRQGLLGWITAWSQCRAVQFTSEGPRRPAEPTTVVADERCAEVVRLLAEMVLVRTRGSGGGG